MKRYLSSFNGATKPASVLLLSLLGLSCSEVRDMKASTEWQYLSVSEVSPLLQPVVIAPPEPMFWMGDDVDLDERPRHQVSLTHPIEVMRTEVTQELYTMVMENNPSFFQRCGLDCPVEKVRWIQTIEFSNRLNQVLGFPTCYVVGKRGAVDWVAGLDCSGWRLPTDEELNILYENKAKIGGFASGYYWSSTEYDDGIAWGQDFYDGYPDDSNKDNDTYVRAVRAF